MIVLNSANVARDLLEKKSANFSDRPRMVVMGELYVCLSYVFMNENSYFRRMGWATSLPFLRYGKGFRRQRRMTQRYFDSQAVDMFRLAQVQGVELFLNDLLKNPEDFRKAIQRYSILQMTRYLSY